MSQPTRTREGSPHPYFRPPLPRRLRPSPPELQIPELRASKLSSPIEQDTHSPPHNPPLSTRYIDMLLQLDTIPILYNILSSIFTWLLLAGYMVFPGTFTSIRSSQTLANGAGRAGKLVSTAVQHIPLVYVAAICCVCGATGMSWLGWLWRANYIWIINRIVLPGLSHSVAGFLSTIINIYTARSGFWSRTAIATAAATGTTTAILLVLFLFCERLLKQIKDDHERMRSMAENRAPGITR